MSRGASPSVWSSSGGTFVAQVIAALWSSRGGKGRIHSHRDWPSAQRSDKMLRAARDTLRGEIWVEPGGAPEWQRLADRRRLFAATVPHPGVVLNAGADVHTDRIEVDVWVRKAGWWNTSSFRAGPSIALPKTGGLLFLGGHSGTLVVQKHQGAVEVLAGKDVLDLHCRQIRPHRSGTGPVQEAGFRAVMNWSSTASNLSRISFPDCRTAPDLPEASTSGQDGAS